MAYTIYKYELSLDDTMRIMMPKGAYPLIVAEQQEYIRLWATVDPQEPEEMYTIYCRGTGHPFNGHEDRHIGTVIVADGRLVFHFFTHKD